VRTTALVEVEADHWDALLAELGCADVYLARGYLEASSRLVEGEPALLHLADPAGDIVFACIIRRSPTDVTTPYGYGGPVAIGADPPVARFAELYERWARDRGVVTSFVVFHPLFANHRYAPPAFARRALAGTVAWPLDGPDPAATLDRHHRRAHRRAVGRAEGAGLELSVHDERPALVDFVPLYEETMRRNGAAPFYFFPAAYWQALEREVSLVRLDARIEGTLVASALCLPSHPWLHYHLGAASDAGRALGASLLVLLAAARWGQKSGFAAFHLGGGVGGREDALLRFKRRFAPDGVRPAFLGTAVHDAVRYRELAGSAASDREGFFPAYRRPR
jgi:hypothetical protein